MNILDWFLIILVGVAATYALIFLVRMNWARREADQARESEAKARKELEPLRKYQTIADIDAEVARIRTQLEMEREAAAIEAQAIRSDARSYAKNQQEQSDQVTASATAESQRILDRAQKRANEIAGDAWKAKENAEQYRRAAIAIRNTIRGYGDDYLKPSESVLDDLADEFDHKQAGAELKAARQRTRTLIKEGHAAECDYVEAHRRDTAVCFVIDAFNGKVDSILSRVKHDNYGTLEQEIRDAFELVNFNGSAFRSARIRVEFLDARMEELRWGAAARELQRQDREEQRAIREAMREEEKARREFEKAIRQAEKEERALEKAMKIAEAKLAEATDAQRALYETELEQLRAQLAEAESREQRAISMAQQTRRGHVYIISNVGSFGDDVFKIGLTRRLEPLDRIRELGDASVPFSFDVHAMIFSEDAPALETELHRRFQTHQVNRVNARKEFFGVSLADIRNVIEELGLNVHWTMRAEAVEYRETQTMIAKDRAVQAQTIVPELEPDDPLHEFDALLGPVERSSQLSE